MGRAIFVVTGQCQQPDMLLLDRTHVEAMLSGLLSPQDLFTELVDRASYRGEVRVPLTDLVVPRDTPALPGLAAGSQGACPAPKARLWIIGRRALQRDQT